MATATTSKTASKTPEADDEKSLYKHKKRPEWGFAILAWEKDDRRAYQFEDGRLRKFKKGYYGLMEPAGDQVKSESRVVSVLEESIEVNRGKGRPDPLEPVASFQAQVDLFKQMYPEGFNDPQWVEDHRGSTPGRTLKRHRDPARQQAQEALSKERFEDLLPKGRHDEIVESALEILAGTSLVPLKHVKALRGMDEDERKRFAEALGNLLHGEEVFTPRLKRYLETLTDVMGGRPSWRLATALPALVHPQDHVCVRRSAFKRQAASIAPLARYSKRARVGPYKNFRRVAFTVKERLEEMGHEPRDLLDVYDFIWATLRNAALDHLEG